MYEFCCIIKINGDNLYCKYKYCEYERDMIQGYHIGLYTSKKVINIRV